MPIRPIGSSPVSRPTTPAAKTPTAKQLKELFGSAQGKLKWSNVPQPGATFGKSIAVTNNKYPDAINVIAHQLKNAPDMVVFEQVGGIAGRHQFSNPVRWDGAAKPTTKAPSAKELNNVYGTYNFHKMLKWTSVPQPGATFAKSVTVSRENHPDGISLIAHFLKNAPNMVVFEQVGGIAGMRRFSQPVRFDVLPK